jgi:hypothetical protein
LDESPSLRMPGENLPGHLTVTNPHKEVVMATTDMNSLSVHHNSVTNTTHILRPATPHGTRPSKSSKPQRTSFREWRETWQGSLNQANAVSRDSRELGELLNLFFGITTDSEYLSLNPKHIPLHLHKFGRISTETINMCYRQLMITLFKQNEAGETGGKQIRSFSDEFKGWQDPSKLDTEPNLSRKQQQEATAENAAKEAAAKKAAEEKAVKQLLQRKLLKRRLQKRLV